jgi:hypothetical protein
VESELERRLSLRFKTASESTIAGSVSKRSTMRSPEACAICSSLKMCAICCKGSNSMRVYARNATRVPRLIQPFDTSTPPRMRAMAAAKLPRVSTIGKYMDESSALRTLASNI